MGGQLVFDWDQQENFLIARDRPVGNIGTNTKCQSCVSQVQIQTVYHVLWCTDRRQGLLRLNHDCHAIICRASIWSATAVGTTECTWPTNHRIIFMYFLEYWLNNALFWYRGRVKSMQNQARLTKWHSAINRSMRSTYCPARVYFSI